MPIQPARLVVAMAFGLVLAPCWGQSAASPTAPFSAPYGVPYGLGFTASTLAEQNRLVDPNAVAGAQKVDLSGLQFGGLRLDFQIQRAAPAPDRLPTLRYTAAVARRDWLRSITSGGPQKVAFGGAFESGAAQGLSFALARQRNGDKGAADSRLGYSRNGLDATFRIRDVSQGLARSSMMSDQEWNDVKDLLGWRQTDMSLAWKGTPGLSLSGSMVRGRNDSSAASRSSRVLDLAWKPGGATDFTFHSDLAKTGNTSASTRTGTERLTLRHTQGGFGFDLSQEILKNVNGKSGRTQKLGFSTPGDAFAIFRADFTEARINGKASGEQKFSLQTREKAPSWLGLTRTQSREVDNTKIVDALQFRAKPAGSLSFDGGLTLTNAGGKRASDGVLKANWKPDARLSLDGSFAASRSAENNKQDSSLKFAWKPGARLSLDGSYAASSLNGKRKMDSGIALDWKPGGDWNLVGNVRETTGALQTMADLKLTGHLDRMTLLDARFLRPVDLKSPYRRQDTLHLERALAKETTLTADYSGLQTMDGKDFGITQLRLNAKLSFAQLSAAHRSGGETHLPNQTELTYKGALGKGAPIALDGRYKRTDGAPTTQMISATWAVRSGLSFEGSFACNPEDDKGKVQDLTRQSLALHLDVCPGLRLDLARSEESRTGFRARRNDLAVKGRLNRLTELDFALTTRDATGLPNDPAVRLAVRHEVDKDHRFLVQLDRQTRAVQGRDDLTARLEVLTDF